MYDHIIDPISGRIYKSNNENYKKIIKKYVWNHIGGSDILESKTGRVVLLVTYITITTLYRFGKIFLISTL